MSQPPPQPKIYHVTHVANLSSIIADGGLVSDVGMIARGGPTTAIGMSTIKTRRVEKLEVKCHPGTKVGDYVPFYFCPRSIMLYVIHCANHAELAYRGGQEPIVHLEADLHSVIAWAGAKATLWAISLSNAGASYAEFRCKSGSLYELDWSAIANPDFRSRDVKEAKQAEFLVHNFVPWNLITHIGVCSPRVRALVAAAVATHAHQPAVSVRRDWYF